MVLIEEVKDRRLIAQEVGKSIASMPLDILFDCLSYVEEDVVWWSFKIDDLVSNLPRAMCI